MSFSSEIKKELSCQLPSARHCRLAEISAILNFCTHVEEGTGAVLLGEVSMCNDDENDNRFYEPIGRFPTIEEDEPAYRLLCNEYPAAQE